MKDELLNPRFIVAYTIILCFAAAYIANPSDTMNGALIAGFAGAWGFYLGSSNASNQVREQIGKALDLARSNNPAQPADVILAPGETAQAKEVR
jgi:hypothetical protein